MTLRAVRSNAIATIAALSLLAGCGGGQASFDAPFASPNQGAAAVRTRSSSDFQVIYSFSRSKSAPVHPEAGVIRRGATLYGTTNYGGTGKCYLGCGILFAMTTTGELSLVHAFAGGSSDGAYPLAPLIDVGGTLYGTTVAGGSGSNCPAGCGTVYAIGNTGQERIVYSFAGKNDGANPRSPVLNVNGTLYGSTTGGGQKGDGTVYAISTSATEVVLHSFAGKPSDGADPSSALIDVNGTLYGTTVAGGASNYGTVFSISPSGTETVLHSFKAGTSDGAYPNGLIAVNGTLYGTTTSGGAAEHCNGGCGIFFRMSTSGTETVLASFTNALGSGTKSLVRAGGVFYGTASGGGADDSGTLFRITPKGVTTVLHVFAGYSNGNDPVGQLLFLKRTIYGTTVHGGGVNKGTVYTFTL